MQDHKSLSFWYESKRLVKIKTLISTIGLIEVMRKVVLIYYFSILSFILLSCGIFAILIQALNQYQNFQRIYFDPVIIFGLILTLLSGFAHAWLLSEKRWIAIFNLETLVRRAIASRVDK